MQSVVYKNSMLKWEDFSLISENIRLIFFDFGLKSENSGVTMGETVFYTFRVYIYSRHNASCAHVCAHTCARI